jgi:hypothetical protein
VTLRSLVRSATSIPAPWTRKFFSQARGLVSTRRLLSDLIVIVAISTLVFGGAVRTQLHASALIWEVAYWLLVLALCGLVGSIVILTYMMARTSAIAGVRATREELLIARNATQPDSSMGLLAVSPAMSADGGLTVNDPGLLTFTGVEE